MKELLVVLLVLPVGFLIALNESLQAYQPAPVPTPQVVRAAVPTPRVVPTVMPNVPVMHGDILSVAEQWLGVPYLWGGCTQHGVDCSCFVKNVLAVFGLNAPRVTTGQFQWGTSVSREELRLGDLVFFNNTCTGCGPNPTHVGMAIGGEMMIDAGDPVKIEPIYWSKFAGARRPPWPS